MSLKMQILRLHVMFERKSLFDQKLIQTNIENRNKIKRNKENSKNIFQSFS